MRGLDEAPHPVRGAGQVEQVGREDVAGLARALERDVVAGVELGLDAEVVRLVPGREVAHPRVADAEGAELRLQLGRRRELVRAAGEPRAREGDQRLDPRGVRRVHPLVELVDLPGGLQCVPGDGDARVLDAKAEERGVAEKVGLLVGDADDGRRLAGGGVAQPRARREDRE